MNFDVAEQLFQALKNLGYEGSRSEFDAHSTIEIALKDIPSLFVSIIDERIWLWSRLTWMSNDTLMIRGGELWSLLQDALPGVVTGQPVLGRGDEGYELKVLVEEQCFQNIPELELLIESFFSLCMRLHSELN